ncbi:PRC-barrel domain-containing protein [Salinithrix halophila]|uniref:PRC-barrel domain-containing protein n=1 Tax=Salinithrix halophila TaxID=1485204 RepID=A0ABV8JD46_9BACL
MRKSQDVIGLPVIHVETGKRLGVVKDLLFDEEQRLRGLLLECGGWIRRGRFIPIERIRSLGVDAVILNSEADIFPLSERQTGWTGLVTGERKLKGRPVLSAGGQAMGTVEDVYFWGEMGILSGYELSDGFFNDLREGRKVIRPETPLTWGEDVLIASLGEPVRDAQ